MFCSQCGNSVVEGAAVCSRCGARLAGPAASPAGGPASEAAGGGMRPATTAPAFGFDVRQWTPGDQVAGLASLVLLISLFLPWFTVRVSGFSAFSGLSASGSGTTAHGWLWIVFVLVLVIFGLLILAAIQPPPRLGFPLPYELVLLVLTGLNLLLVLIAFVDKPSASFVSVGWDYGAFIALIAAIVALVPAVRAIGRRPLTWNTR